MKLYSDNTLKTLLTEKLPDWSINGQSIQRTYKTAGWPGTLMVVNTIAYLSEAAWHHPDLHVGYRSVTVLLTTHSDGGVTDRDIELAAKIDQTLKWRSELPQNGSSNQLITGEASAEKLD
jgi:pterin-4a-carbinolamine dehydratase